MENEHLNQQEYTSYHETKEHGVPNFPYNTYLCSIPLDFREIALPWHKNPELIYIKKGTGQIRVDYEEYLLCAPAIVLILPGQLHAIYQNGTDTMEYKKIIFDSDMLISRQTDKSMSEFLLPMLNGQLAIPTVFTPDTPYYTEISSPIDACDEIGKTRPLGYELYIKSRLYEFFYILASRCCDYTAQPHNRQYLEAIKPVLHIIKNHYSEKITVEQAAKEAGFSASYFMHYFKEIMHCSFITYLNNYRLNIATELLVSSDSSILEIAEATGFSNLSHFNRQFLKKYKVTPREYRSTAHRRNEADYNLFRQAKNTYPRTAEAAAQAAPTSTSLM